MNDTTAPPPLSFLTFRYRKKKLTFLAYIEGVVVAAPAASAAAEKLSSSSFPSFLLSFFASFLLAFFPSFLLSFAFLCFALLCFWVKRGFMGGVCVCVGGGELWGMWWSVGGRLGGLVFWWNEGGAGGLASCCCCCCCGVLVNGMGCCGLSSSSQLHRFRSLFSFSLLFDLCCLLFLFLFSLLSSHFFFL